MTQTDKDRKLAKALGEILSDGSKPRHAKKRPRTTYLKLRPDGSWRQGDPKETR